MFWSRSFNVISQIALVLALGACAANNATPTSASTVPETRQMPSAPQAPTNSQAPARPQAPPISPAPTFPETNANSDTKNPPPAPSPSPNHAESVTAEGQCTPEFLNAYAAVAKAQDDVFNVYRGQQFPDFKIAQKACGDFQEKHAGVSCGAVDAATGQPTTVESSMVEQICQDLDKNRRLVEAATASERKPLDKVAKNLRLKIDNELLLNDMLGGAFGETVATPSPIFTPEGVSCLLKRDNPTGQPISIEDVYRVRLAVQFPKGNVMASYLWLDGNSLVIECLKTGLEPVTVRDLKKALEDQAEVTVLPDSL